MEIISKEGIVSGKISFLRRIEVTHWMGYLTSADQVISWCLVKCFTFWGFETAIRLGIKSCFADVEFSLSASILGLLSPF